MTKTKRALLTSGLALLLCMSMLIGSTYAWFTDSVTSAGNIIKSGTLDVDLVDKDGETMENKVIEFVTADDRAQDKILWEPGCTYETEPVYVVNKGNLAFKYQIVISGIDGNAKLLEAIEWTVTVNGEKTELSAFEGKLYPEEGKDKSGAIVLSGHMKEEAGNEYQDLTVDNVSITVYATQLDAEYDSIDNKYDAEAEYAAATMLKNVAAVAAGETATVKLEKDGYVVLNNENAIGAKVAGDVTLDLNGKTLFVKAEDVDAHQSLFNIVYGGKLTVTGNGTIEMVSGKNASKVTAIFNNTSGTLVIENGTYKMDHMDNWQDSLIPTIIDNNGNAKGATTTINGGNFYHTRNMFRNFPSNNGITELIINGGTFNGEADDWAAIWNQKASSDTNEGQSLVTVNGGTFNYVEIDNEFETGVTIADGVKMPALVSTYDEIVEAVKNGSDIYFEKDITVDQWIMFSETLSIGSGNIINVPTIDVTIEGNGHTLTVNSIESAGNGNSLFYDATELNISNLTINMNCGRGAIGLTSGVIENVVFNYQDRCISPAEDCDITIKNCVFNTGAQAIYYETARDNLEIINNTFNIINNGNAVILRGTETFTGNTVNSGRTVNVVSSNATVKNNVFHTRVKLYNDGQALSDNVFGANAYIEIEDGISVDVSGNYWGGSAPSSTQIPAEISDNVTVNNYYTTYVDGTLGGLME